MRSRRSQSSRAGLIFPVSRVNRNFKLMPLHTRRITKTAAVYATAVFEYLTAEILELGGNACRDNQRYRITPRHLMLAIGADEELNKLLKNVTIPGGGVLPHINVNLLGNKVDGATTTNDNAAPSESEEDDHKPKKLKKIAKKINSKKARAKPRIAAPVGILQAALIAQAPGVNTCLLSDKTLLTGQNLMVLQADIVNVAVDAIVHPTSNSIYMGGQVGSAIAAKGGHELQMAVAKIKKNNLGVCEVVLSEAGTQMSCSSIIHVHSPSWDTNDQLKSIQELEKCVVNILSLANENELQSIAIPSISSGGNGFPKQIAAETILRAIKKYFSDNKDKIVSIKHVSFVLFDAESVGIYTSELGKLDATTYG